MLGAEVGRSEFFVLFFSILVVVSFAVLIGGDFFGKALRRVMARGSVVYATIEPDLWTMIQEIAKKEGVSETVLVRRLLVEALSSPTK